ncbi:hypothetical protein [Prochlorococcus sp. MIT 0601]|uniref:hypothetical protein n=1 Tax=Prochlorococcus sp. MIT 0601 TaxID=1499498 RepID=UPI000533ACF0|nr:hypothetical protein [Prochlorococcus sp. MIT 0601]KGG12007.1 hypothetical protein EV05_1210 [Prochlorococcus sp. MIT 0601]
MQKIKEKNSSILPLETIDSYFECITNCSLVGEGIECITECVAIHLKEDVEDD